MPVHRVDIALLVLRVCFGLGLAAHGFNKVFGGNGLKGTAGWFASIGMKWPMWQARIAASTEIGAGILLALGLATPFASAGFVGIMLVAIVVTHWHNGFYIFRKGEGWEYCASILVVALFIATIGAGEYSIDHAIDKDVSGWTGLVIAAVLGIGGGLFQLAVSYRKPKPAEAS